MPTPNTVYPLFKFIEHSPFLKALAKREELVRNGRMTTIVSHILFLTLGRFLFVTRKTTRARLVATLISLTG